MKEADKMKHRILSALLVIAMLLCVVGCGGMKDETGNNNSSNTEKEENNSNEEVNEEVKEKKHKVIFDYNDGSGRKEEIEIPNGEGITEYAPYVAEGLREIVAWSSITNGNAYQAAVTQSMTLYAQWKSYECKVYTSDVPDSLNDRFIEINISGFTSEFSGRVLRIGPNVKSVSIISDGSVIDRFAIIVSERSSNLEISMENLAFKSNNIFGISGLGNSNYTMKLKITGNVMIDCVAYSACEGTRGADCIKGSRVEIYGNGTLSLYAGNGKNGADKPNAGDGQDGQRGDNGISGGAGIVAESVDVKNVTLNIVGGNGGNGGKGGAGNVGGGIQAKGGEGGDGGHGGAGGDAVVTKSFKVTSANINLTGGNGGKGGKGGNGGGGGILFVGTYKMAGDGGNGGNGGSVFSGAITKYEASGTATQFNVGSGGFGGGGGDGGMGFEGIAGANGSSGNINTK